ncbi:MAG TPA: AAA family ATPase [Solirubrobacterales bacterium]|nr:AAA family ATPase [Solirubrobacterales bacterium]
MTVTSRHLPALADYVQSGAHVILRGHLGDEVLAGDGVFDEIGAIGDLLQKEAGMEAVIVANQADGVYCLDRSRERLVGDMIAAERLAAAGAGLGATQPYDIAQTVRALLSQDQMPVAVVLQEAALLLQGRQERDRQALGVLIEAMAEACIPNPNGPTSPRNTLIVFGTPSGPVIDQIAAVPGVVELEVDAPDRSERLAALRFLGPDFYGAEEEDALDKGLESLARITHGYSLRGLEQLRRRSHAVQISPARPESLYRAARRERGRTPIDRLGVDSIMAMLEEEIVGQERAMASIRRVLERGRWRSANRPPGSTLTRPMAKMVLHGPTGVGKTETAYILAEAIVGSRDAVRRIDCAEFHGDHDTARLTGAPPGYVGHDEGGAFSGVTGEEAAVIVLDEFDRGPPRLVEMLLGILDAGRLTDGRGRTVTFENTIMILTTNAGAAKLDESAKLVESSEGDLLPDTETLLNTSEAILEEKLKAPRIENGVGSRALWSRLQDSLVGYDYLRRGALKAMVGKSCRHLEANLGDEFGVWPRFDAELFAESLDGRLPRDGTWDGRSVAPLIYELIEGPARAALEESPRPDIEFVPDDEGRAMPLST